MSLTRLEVMYGHLQGTPRKFAREPSGYLAVDAGIFRQRGLEVSWRHVQGTEERYRQLQSGSAHLSLVVGRASLAHFLEFGTTRILGSPMSSCPYFLVVRSGIDTIRDLKNGTIACRESVARIAPLAETFQRECPGADPALRLPGEDHEAFDLLIAGKVDGALLPRPYGFMAEEKGFGKLAGWPEVVDDPLPITIETTARLWRDREKDFRVFLDAYSEGIRYLKSHRTEAVRMLGEKFDHSASFAATTFDDYFVWLDDRLTVDFRQLEKLLSQVAPGASITARQLASEWIVPGAVTG
jgi:ABC-type nitrate/sulfonate/bicarbonate transport system substrate-binding protein